MPQCVGGVLGALTARQSQPVELAHHLAHLVHVAVERRAHRDERRKLAVELLHAILAQLDPIPRRHLSFVGEAGLIRTQSQVGSSARFLGVTSISPIAPARSSGAISTSSRRSAALSSSYSTVPDRSRSSSSKSACHPSERWGSLACNQRDEIEGDRPSSSKRRQVIREGLWLC